MSADTSAAGKAAQAEFAELPRGAAGGNGQLNLDLIMDVRLALTLEVGRARISVRNLLGLTQGALVGVACLAIFLVYQQLENHVLQPMIIGRAVRLSPPATMVVTRVEVTLGQAGGGVTLVLPLSSFEPVRDKLAEGLKTVSPESRQRWHKSLRSQLENAHPDGVSVDENRAEGFVQAVVPFVCHGGPLRGAYTMRVRSAQSSKSRVGEIGGEGPQGVSRSGNTRCSPSHWRLMVL